MNKFLGVAVLGAAFSLQAGVVCEINGAKDLNFTNRVKATGEKQFKVVKTGWLRSTKYYPIDPTKSYRIQGELRAAPGEKAAGKCSIGFYPVTEKNQIIGVNNVHSVKGSETELAAQVNIGDKVFKVKDASKWKKGGYAAFDIDPSGKMRDLPCFSVCNSPITAITKNGDVWDVEVKTPIRTAYAAGVPMREHLPGWSFLCSDSMVPGAEWQNVSWTVKPGAVKGNTRSQWLFGAKKFLVILVLYAGTECRNVTVEEVE